MNRHQKYRRTPKGKDTILRYRHTKMGKLMRRLQQYQMHNTFFECTREDLTRIVDTFDNRCAYCGEDISRLYYFDHVVAVKKDGPTVPANLVPCCRSCNESKMSRSIIDVMQLRPGRLPLFARILNHCATERGRELVVPMLESQVAEAVTEEVPF